MLINLKYSVYVKTAFIASSLGMIGYYVMSKFMELFVSRDALFTEGLARIIGQLSGMIFLATLCFFLLLGIGRKYLKLGARKALAMFIATGVLTNIIMNIFLDVYVIEYKILMLAIILPLGLFYSNEPKYLFLHWFKVASLFIVLKLIYDFIRYQIFTGIFFMFYSLTLQTSLMTYLNDLTFLLTVSFVFWKFIGKYYETNIETKDLRLKEYFRRFLKGELEYGAKVD